MKWLYNISEDISLQNSSSASTLLGLFSTKCKIYFIFKSYLGIITLICRTRHVLASLSNTHEHTERQADEWMDEEEVTGVLPAVSRWCGRLAGQPFHIPDHELSAAGPSDLPQPASFYCSAGGKRHSTLDLRHTPWLTDGNTADLGLKHIYVVPAIIITNTLKRTHR